MVKHLILYLSFFSLTLQVLKNFYRFSIGQANSWSRFFFQTDSSLDCTSQLTNQTDFSHISQWPEHINQCIYYVGACLWNSWQCHLPKTRSGTWNKANWSASKRHNEIWGLSGVGFVGFYGISTFVGYLTPNPFLCK